MVEQRAVCFEGCAVIVEAAEDTIFVVVEYSIKGVEVDVVEVRRDNLVATAVDNTAAVVGLDDSAIFKEVSSPFIACRDYLSAEVVAEAVEPLFAEANGAVVAIEALVGVCCILALDIAE